jgi:hypothetical protein
LHWFTFHGARLCLEHYPQTGFAAQPDTLETASSHVTGGANAFYYPALTAAPTASAFSPGWDAGVARARSRISLATN